MKGVPTFVPAPLVNESDYGQYARRPGSASRQRPSSAKLQPSRPSSAKAYVPQRPQSAKARHERHSVDYTGVSNMIKSLNIKKGRQWREKSPEGKRTRSPPPRLSPSRSKQAWSSEKDNVSLSSNISSSSNKQDLKYMRSHRSSYYSKFKYSPESHYGSKLGYRAFLERNIPQCLRRTALYGNLPKRQSCNFKPPNSVTQIKWHSLKSSPLPAYKGPVVPRSKSAPASVQGDDHDKEEVEEKSDSENLPLNGSYHFVYEGNNSQSEIIREDTYDNYENDEELNRINNNQTPRNDDYSDDEFEEDVEPPESVEIPVRDTPVSEEVQEIDSARSWVDPDTNKDYYEKRALEEEEDIINEEIVDNFERHSDIAESIKSDHSVKSLDSHQSQLSKSSKSSKQSKASTKSSSKSSSLKFSDSDMRDILDDNTEDPIDEYLSGTQTFENGRFSRMGTQDNSRFKKTVRIQEPVTPRKESLIHSEDDDDIPEDYGSDNDKFDMNDLSSLPPLGGPGGGLTPVAPAVKSRYTRPASARRRITEDDY